MPQISYWLRRHGADTCAVLFMVVCLVLMVGPVVQAGLDRNQRCVANAYQLTQALLIYVSDYDEVLPVPGVLANTTAFRNLIMPYARDSALFLCPATGNIPFVPNQAVGGKSLSTLEPLEAAEALRDAKAHPDGKLTIAFLDGHVERGGVDQPYADGTIPATKCVQRQRQILTGLYMYMQDYDEVFPHQQSDAGFKSAIHPYIKNSRVYNCPDTNLPFVLGKAFRGQAFSSITDLSPVVVVEDAALHKTQIKTTTYLDQYTEQRVRRGIVYPSAISESQVRIGRMVQALHSYLQDNSGRLPVYTNYDEFAAVVGPYTRASRSLLPPRGGQSFQVNLDVSGLKLTDIPNSSSVIILRDVNQYGDGMITVGYLDGRVKRLRP